MGEKKMPVIAWKGKITTESKEFKELKRKRKQQKFIVKEGEHQVSFFDENADAKDANSVYEITKYEIPKSKRRNQMREEIIKEEIIFRAPKDDNYKFYFSNETFITNMDEGDTLHKVTRVIYD